MKRLLAIVALLLFVVTASDATAQCANGVCRGPAPVFQPIAAPMPAPTMVAPAVAPPIQSPQGRALQVTLRSPVLFRSINEPQPMPPMPVVRYPVVNTLWEQGNKPFLTYCRPPACRTYYPMHSSCYPRTVVPTPCYAPSCYAGPDPFLRR